MRRIRRALVTAAATVLLYAMMATAAVAAFNAITSNPGNSFSTAPDFARPEVDTVDPPVIKHSNGTAGFVKAGQGFYVYAKLTDAGNPSSGITSATANVSSLGGSATAALSSGSFTPHNYRSALLTVTAGTTEGAKAFSITSGDGAGNSGTDGGYSVTVDNTAPAVAAGAAGAVIQKSSGGKAGFLKASAPYYIYANPTDAGSGVTTVTANVSTVTTGANAVALTTAGGPWTGIDGNSYTHRSAQQTANAGLTAGAKTFTFTGTDAVTNSATTSNYTVTGDNTAPTGDRFAIIKGEGGKPSFIRQGSALGVSGTGGTYYVYANVTDATSGIDGVTANLASGAAANQLKTGETAAPLPAWGGSAEPPAGGAAVTYSHRSASMTPNAAVTEGAKTWTVTITDGAGNTASPATTGVTVDNTKPVPTDIIAAGGTTRQPQAADTVIWATGKSGATATADPIDPYTVFSNWNGVATYNVTARLSPTEFLTLTNDSAVASGLGSIENRLYNTNTGVVDAVFGASATRSTLAWGAVTNTITLTLGTLNSGATVRAAAGNNQLRWTPPNGLTDRAGNPLLLPLPGGSPTYFDEAADTDW